MQAALSLLKLTRHFSNYNEQLQKELKTAEVIQQYFLVAAV